MKFEIVPILDTLLTIYSKPISLDRFHEYISTLKGSTKSDLEIPITGFNPMAKQHVIDKIQELKSLNAEMIIQHFLETFNQKQTNHHKTFKIFINVADDVQGGWTNHYTTDFDSKFKINALITRAFCTPYFWTSETYSKELIQQRIKEYMFRTIFWEKEGKLNTLEDHINQERYVAKMMNYTLKQDNLSDFESLNAFYIKNKYSTDYNLIFNFMYGDQVCETLSYPTHGIKNLNGFDFAKI